MIQNQADQQHQVLPPLCLPALFFWLDGKALVTQRVGDGRCENGKPLYPDGKVFGNPASWIHLPDEDDPRWEDGQPPLDTSLLTLSPFAPSGRLGYCVEAKPKVPHFRNANHPAFQGVKKWMRLDTLRSEAAPLMLRGISA